MVIPIAAAAALPAVAPRAPGVPDKPKPRAALVGAPKPIARPALAAALKPMSARP